MSPALIRIPTLTALICLLSFSLIAPNASQAASAKKIDRMVNTTLKVFYDEVDGAENLIKKSKGALVFPKVYKAGLGIGGEYGEGALRIGGKTAAYYSTAAASIGFQLGAQKKSIIIIFLTQEALDKFRDSDGWEVGVDGSVAVIDMGAGGSVDTTNYKDPIIAFVFDQAGLMYNLTLEGSKITELDR